MNDYELEVLLSELDSLTFIVFVAALEQEKEHELNPHISGTASIVIDKLEQLKELRLSKAS